MYGQPAVCFYFYTPVTQNKKKKFPFITVILHTNNLKAYMNL